MAERVKVWRCRWCGVQLYGVNLVTQCSVVIGPHQWIEQEESRHA